MQDIEDKDDKKSVPLVMAVIGDIHGRLDLLLNLVSKINAKYGRENVRYAFTGDLIDRGPNSYEVTEYAKDEVENNNAIYVIGNHELWACEVVEENIGYMRVGEPPRTNNMWFNKGNGGRDTMESYNSFFGKYGVGHFCDQFIKSGHYKFFKETPLFYEDEEIFLSHAPVPKPEFISNYWREAWRENANILTWGYVEFANEEAWTMDHGKLAICGHIHRLNQGIWKSRKYDNIIFNDSGAGCSPKAVLTAVIVDSGKFVEFIESDVI